MNTAAREICHRLLDVLIRLVLFVLACAFAGAIQRYIFPNTDWLDIVWFSIGMLPVIFYARYRGVCRYDKWDIVAYSPLPFVLMGVHELAPGEDLLLVKAFEAPDSVDAWSLSCR